MSIFRVLRLIFGSLMTMEALSPIVNGLLCNRLYDEIEKFLGFGETLTISASGAPEATVCAHSTRAWWTPHAQSMSVACSRAASWGWRTV